MKFLTSIKEFLKKDLAWFSGDISPDVKKPVFPEWYFSARLGQPRLINIPEIRTFARSPWIQMVLNTIKKEVSTIHWEVMDREEDGKTGSEAQIQQIKDFLDCMNTEDESIEDLTSMAITDLGEIDAGAWVNVYSMGSYDFKDAPVLNELGKVIGSEKRLVLKPLGQRQLLEVRPADSATFLKQIDIYRRVQGFYQYSFKNPRTNPIRFEPEEMNYMHLNKKSYSIYGFSPVQSVQQVLQILMQSTRWNKDFYKNNAIADGGMFLPGADEKSLKKFKNEWNKEVKGKPHKFLFFNVEGKFQQFQPNNRDMEWLEGQKWYHWLVFAVFGVSPVEAGFHENVSQGNTEGQERITVKNAIKPYLKLIEKVVNNRIIPEILQTEKPDVIFKFIPKDHTLEKIEHEQNMVELREGALTINEYRKSKGKLPVEWGDEPYKQVSPQSINIGNQDPKDPKDPGNQAPKPDEEKDNKYFRKYFSKHMNDVRNNNTSKA